MQGKGDITNNPMLQQMGNEDVGKVLPNNAKSQEGYWYNFKGQFKLEEIKKDTEADDSYRKPKYKVTVKFPTHAAIGINLAQMELTGNEDHQWSHYWYHMYEDDKKPNCDSCWKVIDKEKLIEGKDWIQDSEGEYLHLECAVKPFKQVPQLEAAQ